MEIIIRESPKIISQRKLEVFEQVSKIVNWGRENPVRFAEEIYGYKLIDYQCWTFMNCWVTPFCCLVESRGAGKDLFMAVFFMTKMVLIPVYNVFVSSNSYEQSATSFKRIEAIALRRFPAFKSATDIFLREVEKSHNSETGFIQSPHFFRLHNGSELLVLSNNTETIRGKRGSVWFNEVGWKTAEELAVAENFAIVDSSFATSTSKIERYDPIQMPLQLLYTSSASDVTYPFYDRYRKFARKMFIGDSNYFAFDLDAHDVINHSTIDGEPIKSHLTQEFVDKAIEDDPDLADRELFNKFRKGQGQNSVVKMETIIHNSTVRRPLLYNDTGKKKFILCYDPARNFDGSMLGVFQEIHDEKIGCKLQIENMISMFDKNAKKKTPLPMPEQLEIIKETMIKYNGEKAAEWENIELYIDAGSGGGGVSAVADQLMNDWVDAIGQKHRGIIDPVHSAYETARRKYTNAMPIVTLINPGSYKKIIFDSLEKMTKLNLINFTEYDNTEYLLIKNANGKLEEYYLSFEERMALTYINLTKNELVYMCRYETPNGNVQYELAKDKKNTMHDDKAYVTAMAAYALALKRRSDLVEPTKGSSNIGYLAALSSAPQIRKRR